eukprot:CAMPEP_0114309426 /NCGR_PEP_ID=MMETSP0059-20121206/18629_1 /TAXON_ID=36894 /ORGANISM="Pyramimonas parkeae, Strain CCMP726" /LENGTH=175 /DNA_ID=CAMNT_0001433221 /DNA_START=23 /DNA_END=550 /DNA_ORIENTATION=+
MPALSLDVPAAVRYEESHYGERGTPQFSPIKQGPDPTTNELATVEDSLCLCGALDQFHWLSWANWRGSGKLIGHWVKMESSSRVLDRYGILFHHLQGISGDEPHDFTPRRLAQYAALMHTPLQAVLRGAVGVVLGLSSNQTTNHNLHGATARGGCAGSALHKHVKAGLGRLLRTG